MKFVVKFTELSRRDYRTLDGSQKKQILKSLKKIEENGMLAGQELQGQLFDCRKLKHKINGLASHFQTI